MDMGNATHRIGVSLAISLVLDIGLFYTLALFFSGTDVLDNPKKGNGPIQIILLPEVVHHTDQSQKEAPAQVTTKPLQAEPILDTPNIEQDESPPVCAQEVFSDNNKEASSSSNQEKSVFLSVDREMPGLDLGVDTSITEVSIAGIKSWLDEQIPRYLEYPPLARKRGIEGISRIELTVDATGLLVQQRIVQSSGNAILDKAALEVVRRVFPIPRELCKVQEQLVLTIGITYSLR